MIKMDDTQIQPVEKKPNNMLLIAGLGIGLAVVGGAFLLRGNSAQEVPNQANSALPTQSSNPIDSGSNDTSIMVDDTEGTVANARMIQIEAGSFYFNPSEIRVKKGETITIELTSVDMMHDFNIDEFNVALPITPAGETNSVTFVADKAGEFEYYCSVGQHRANGQVGTLIVEE